MNSHVKPIYKQNNFGEDEIGARGLWFECLMTSGSVQGPSRKQMAHSNWVTWGTEQYHGYYLQARWNEGGEWQSQCRNCSLMSGPWAWGEAGGINNPTSHSSLPLISWLYSLLSNPKVYSEGKGTHGSGPFRPASQGHSWVEKPTENNQNILLTHRDASVTSRHSEQCSLSQTQFPIICRWYLPTPCE